MELIKRLVLFALLWCIGTILAATQMPFYARWQSLNSMYYDALQEGKELSWDEAYRAEFGFKGKFYHGILFALDIETEQFFDEPQLRLKSIFIGHDTGKLFWQAGSYPRGYGFGFAMDEYPALEHGYNQYRYQSMRMNSLDMQLSIRDDMLLSTELGGNKHNQASALISFYHLPENTDYKCVLRQDLRTMDNHWRTPVSISSIDLSYLYSGFNFNLDAAVAILPKWEATVAHHEIFVMTELQHLSESYPAPALGLMYKKQNYAPYETQQYQLRLEQKLGRFTLVPLTNIHLIDGEDMWQHRLFAKYHLNKIIETESYIGMYYDYSYFGKDQGRHSFGLALDFKFDSGFQPQLLQTILPE